MAATAPTAGIVPPVPSMGALAISPTWAELFALPQQVFTDLRVDFVILSASLFTSTDGPESLLSRVEALVHCSPVILVLISDEEPNNPTKSPCSRTLANMLAAWPTQALWTT